MNLYITLLLSFNFSRAKTNWGILKLTGEFRIPRFSVLTRKREFLEATGALHLIANHQRWPAFYGALSWVTALFKPSFLVVIAEI